MPVVLIFTFTICVVHKQPQTWCMPQRGPLQHLFVTIRIPEGENGTSSNLPIDTDRLPLFVVNEIKLSRFDNFGNSVFDLKSNSALGTNDLFWRNPVNFFSPHSHEVKSTSRNDIGLEAIGTQIIQHFQHGLIRKVSVTPLESSMLGLFDPIRNTFLEFNVRHPCMCRAQNRNQPSFHICFDHIHVTVQSRSKVFVVFPLRMLWSKSLQFSQRKEQLERQWILGPQCSVVIKNSDPVCFWDKLITGRVGHRVNEFHKRSFGVSIIPRAQCNLLR